MSARCSSASEPAAPHDSRRVCRPRRSPPRHRSAPHQRHQPALTHRRIDVRPTSQPSTIRLDRTSPQAARITSSNPPVNLVVPETIVALRDVVAQLEQDPEIKVVVLESEVPDFFFNH